MPRYFDGMGQDVTAYVNELENHKEKALKEIAGLVDRIVKLEAKASKKKAKTDE